MRTLFAALLFIMLLFSACSYPPFNQDISLSVAALSKMNKFLTIGPLTLPDAHDYWENTNVYFIPDKDWTTSGFAVVQEDTCFRIWYIELDSVSHRVLTVSNSCEVCTGGDDGWGQDFYMDTIPGSKGNLLFINASDMFKGITFFNWDGNNLNKNPQSSLVDKIWGSGYRPSGANFSNQEDVHINGIYLNVMAPDASPTPIPTATPDPSISPSPDTRTLNLYVLFSDVDEEPQENDYYECVIPVNYNSLGTIQATRPSPIYFDMQIYNDGYYCFDPLTQRSYFYSPAGHRYMIDNLGAVRSLPFSVPPVAVLSNSSIFASTKETGYFFSDSFGQISKFPIGSVRFIYERKVNYQDILYFSKGAVFDVNDGPNEVFLNLYTVPLNQLSSLNY